MAAASIMILVAVLLKSIFWVARAHGWVPPTATWAIYFLTAPFSKLPPSPAYLLFYGGLAGLTLGSLLRYGERARPSRALRLLARVGRNSLFAFVFQYYVFYGLFPLLRLPYSAAWPLWFLSALALVFSITAVWDAIDGNRFITLGIPKFAAKTGAAPRLAALRHFVARAGA